LVLFPRRRPLPLPSGPVNFGGSPPLFQQRLELLAFSLGRDFPFFLADLGMLSVFAPTSATTLFFCRCLSPLTLFETRFIRFLEMPFVFPPKSQCYHEFKSGKFPLSFSLPFPLLMTVQFFPFRQRETPRSLRLRPACQEVVLFSKRFLPVRPPQPSLVRRLFPP